MTYILARDHYVEISEFKNSQLDVIDCNTDRKKNAIDLDSLDLVDLRKKIKDRLTKNNNQPFTEAWAWEELCYNQVD